MIYQDLSDSRLSDYYETLAQDARRVPLTNAERQQRFRESVAGRTEAAILDARRALAEGWLTTYGGAAFSVASLLVSARVVPTLQAALQLLAPPTVRGEAVSSNRLSRELRRGAAQSWAPAIRLELALPDVWRFVRE